MLRWLIAAAFAVVAVLYQIDADPAQWEAEGKVVLHAKPEQISRFMVNPDNVEKYFRWVSSFRAADTRPLGVGKKYQAIFNIPVLGEYVMILHVVEYKAANLIVLESNSFVKPRITVTLEEVDPRVTQLVLRMIYRRTSALFQWLIGPAAYLITSQQLKHSLFLLKMMFPF